MIHQQIMTAFLGHYRGSKMRLNLKVYLTAKPKEIIIVIASPMYIYRTKQSRDAAVIPTGSPRSFFARDDMLLGNSE